MCIVYATLGYDDANAQSTDDFAAVAAVGFSFVSFALVEATPSLKYYFLEEQLLILSLCCEYISFFPKKARGGQLVNSVL